MTDLNLHQRIAKVMGEVTYIKKEQKKGMNYTIVSHDVVTAKVRPALLGAGVIYYPAKCTHTHNGNRAECDMTVRFVNIDKPEEFIDVEVFGYGVDPQDKGPGKAMSYAVKYALLKCLGLETGDDADHDNIDHSTNDPAVPPFNPSAARDRMVKSLAASKTLEILGERWAEYQADIHEVKAAAPAMFGELVKAKDERKAALAASLTNQGAG